MQSTVKRFAAGSEYFFREGCHIVELDNDAASPELSIARARVEPTRTTRWHALRSTVERYVILSGSGVVELASELPQRVSVGDVVIIPADCRQRIYNDRSEDLIFLAICSPRFEAENYVDLDDAAPSSP